MPVRYETVPVRYETVLVEETVPTEVIHTHEHHHFPSNEPKTEPKKEHKKEHKHHDNCEHSYKKYDYKQYFVSIWRTKSW